MYELEQDTELWDVCGHLNNAKEIQLEMRSMGMPFDLRYEFPEETKGDIFYKCTEYYDSDSYVNLCVFDENGLHNLEENYNGTFEDIKDIQRWYSGTPVLCFTSESEMENEELYSYLLESLNKLKQLMDTDDSCEFNNFVEDCWKEDGEISISSSISFRTENIREINHVLSEIVQKLSVFDSCDFELEIYAVPDGQNDYDFASVGFVFESEQVKTKYIRF